ncbi:hypothetical protein GQ457_07G010120 [Hibiscus cannabinus]
MKQMGFGIRWCHWISLCLSTAYISVLVNGSPTAPFSIGRGLRQGCPLSLLAFNIVAEALSALLNKAIQRGFFCGFSIGQSNLDVSHIQFVDDLILFCGAAEIQIKTIIRLLKGFELAVGLKLNLQKSKLIGISVAKERIEAWASLLNCKSEKLPCTWDYLWKQLGTHFIYGPL